VRHLREIKKGSVWCSVWSVVSSKKKGAPEKKGPS
jgi:hypothetical protein